MRLRSTALMFLTAAFIIAEPRAQNPAAPAASAEARPEPNPLGQPLVDPNGFVRDDAMLRAPALLRPRTANTPTSTARG